MKIEIRKDCKVCGGDLPTRFRTFCSTQCRNKHTNQRCSEYHKQWQNEKRGQYSEDKLKCGICGKWYV